MSETFIKTIHKVRVTKGKYTEFWFKEDLLNIEILTEKDKWLEDGSWNACMKTYMLIEAMEKENILSDVLTTGLKNRKTIWKYGSPSKTGLEFVSFECETRMVLIEKIK